MNEQLDIEEKRDLHLRLELTKDRKINKTLTKKLTQKETKNILLPRSTTYLGEDEENKILLEKKKEDKKNHMKEKSKESNKEIKFQRKTNKINSERTEVKLKRQNYLTTEVVKSWTK
jgi:hypothetical protein